MNNAMNNKVYSSIHEYCYNIYSIYSMGYMCTVCTLGSRYCIIEIILTAGIDHTIHGTVMGKTSYNANSLGSI